jgi:hypothetical protein
LFALCALALALASCGAEKRPGAIIEDGAVIALPPSDVFVSPLDAAVVNDAAGMDAVTTVDAPAPDRMRYEDVSLPLEVGYPAGPYGDSVGARLAPFSLPDCFGRNVSFADDRFYSSRASLIALYAGHCAQCQTEVRELEATVAYPYRDRRLRVIVVLVEGTAPAEPATSDLCLSWTRMSNAIAQTLLTDPASTMQRYVPVRRYPAYLLVNSRAEIVWRTGLTLTSALQDARQQVEQFFATNP